MTEPASDSSPVGRLMLKRRLEALSSGSPATLFAYIVSTLLLVYLLITPANRPVMLVWAATAIAIMIVRIVLALSSNPHSEDVAAMRHSYRIQCRLVLASSTIWAVILPWLTLQATPLELVVLALLSMGVFLGVLINRLPPIHAIYTALVSSASTALAAWMIAGWASLVLILLVALVCFTVITAALRNDRVLVESSQAEIQRNDSERTIRSLLNEYESQANDWLWTVGPNGNLREVSERFAEALDRDRQDVEGTPLLDYLAPGPERDRIAQVIDTRSPFIDLPASPHGGEAQHWLISGRPRSDGRMTGVVRDITEARAIEARMAYMAHYDSLTGLANRYRFNERLSAALGPHGNSARNVALFYLGIDDFKAINDTEGHRLGDMVLREIGQRLGREVRDCDLVARLGGDEFAILIETGAGDGMLIERAHRFLSVVREPLDIAAQVFRLTASVGVARCDAERCEAEELMRRADLALHAAKAKGRDQFAMFDHALDREAQERRQLETDLKDALTRDEFRLHYQPVIDLDNGATVAYEALLRWQHPTRGLIPPNLFLPIAEATGVIVPLGDWVIRQALREMGPWDGDFRVAINLSPSQLRNPMLVATVEEALAVSGVAAERIEFEITEQVLLDDTEFGLATVRRLRELGTSIALDDFGTGYSSLSYLRNFPFDRIKIDRAFVRDVVESETARAIVSTITRLADALGSSTTAEGVEQPEQLDLLRKLGCHEAQGFLILRPVSAERLDAAQIKGIDLPNLGAEVLDYRRARKQALKRRDGQAA